MTKRLVLFVCSKCGRELCYTLPQAQVLCPRCNRWNSHENSEKRVSNDRTDVRQSRKDELSS